MRRSQLEHIIRAATGITGTTQWVIVGSQAVLGQYPESPDELLASVEADVFSLREPADNDLVDGSIGEGSPFHQTFGYYAHGVSAETAVLPQGWRDRLVSIHNANTGVARACVLRCTTWLFPSWLLDVRRTWPSWALCNDIALSAPRRFAHA